MAGTSYTRQSTIADGNIITAALFNNEFNQLINAFAYASSGTTGHSHDGSAGQGAAISKIGDQDFNNKVVISAANNRIEFYSEVSGSPVEQVRIQDGAIVPVTDSDVDLGTTSVRFKDAYIDSATVTGTVSAATITSTGTTNIVTGVVTGDMTFTGAAYNAVWDTSTNTMRFADNAVMAVGDSSELKIYYDGSNSYIKEAGTGSLYITADTQISMGSSFGAASLVVEAANGTTFSAGGSQKMFIDSGGVNIPDNVKINLGNSDDLQIFHDGSNSRITDTGTGNLYLTGANNISLLSNATTYGVFGTSVDLYYSNGKRFETTASGATISGTLAATSSVTAQAVLAASNIDTPQIEVTTLKARDGSTAGTIADSTGVITLNNSVLTTTDINGGTIDGTAIGGSSPSSGAFSSLSASGATFTTATITGGSIGSSHLTFADNNKAIFGNDGDELSIYHNGTSSIIEDQGTGNLLIKGTQLKLQSADGEDYATFTNNGAAKLFNNGVEKLSTSGTGVTISGKTNTGQIEVTTLRANDGTSAGSIADSTGVVTLASSVLTTADIDGGTADNVVIGGTTAAAGNFTTLGATDLISGTDITLTDSTPRIQFNDSDGTDQKTELVQAGGSFVTTVRNNTSHGSIDFKSNNGTNNLLRFRVATDGDFNFYENNGSTVGVKWDAPNGRLGVGTTSPAQKLHVDGKIITTEGIYLGGTGGANLLEDYEEGTFTPTLFDKNATDGNQADVGTTVGTYTKVGDVVTCVINLSNINTSTNSMVSGQQLHIHGLPFTSRANRLVPVPLYCVQVSTGSPIVGPFAIFGGNGTFMQLRVVFEGGGTSALDVSAINSTSSDIHLAFSYHTDS